MAKLVQILPGPLNFSIWFGPCDPRVRRHRENSAHYFVECCLHGSTAVNVD